MEYVLSFRFEHEPGPAALDAIRGAVQTVCEIYRLQRPNETVGDPPFAAYVPPVEQIADLILSTESNHADADETR